MMYTRERLIKAVREAGRDGQPFTLGEVRAQLGLKSGLDKREMKRFRSRWREANQFFGDGLEKLGPNTFRLRGAQLEAAAKVVVPVVLTPKPALKALKLPVPPPFPKRSAEPAAAPERLIDRVAATATPRAARVPTPTEDGPGLVIPTRDVPPPEPELYASTRRPKEAISFVTASSATRSSSSSFGERVSSWFGRSSKAPTAQTAANKSAAATALSRLAVELQPKSGGFEYRWIDGKLQVQRAEK
jgi:hypothetical protein